MLSQYNFEKTIRFVFFTGEEQGIYGSKNYASKVVSDGDNIVAVVNMDIIGTDNVGGPVSRIHTRTSSSSGYSSDLVLAYIFKDVVNTYGMSSDLSPIIDPDGITASDHSSFWNKGISSICVSEDDKNDMTKNLHTTRDRVSTLNIPYLTNIIRVIVGTGAHMAGPSHGYVLNASFSYTKNKLEVNFADTTKAPGGAVISNWNWNFGDGRTSTEKNPVHTYAEIGTYTVKLIVTDQEGITSSYTEDIVVTNEDGPEEPECWEECEEVGEGCNKETVCETVCEE